MKKVLALILSAALCLSMAACDGGSTPTTVGSQPAADSGKTDSADESKSGTKTIAVMPKLVGIPYFTQTGEGAQQAGKDLGVNVIYTGPTKADAAEQVKMIEDLITRKVDAICVAPNDAAAVIPVLQKAKAAGILILDWDTPVNDEVVDASVHQIDDKEFGEHLVDQLVKAMGTDSGDFAYVTGGLSAPNLNAWYDAGMAYAKTKYPNLHLVTDKIPTDEKQQVAYTKTLDLIKAYPDLKGIIALSTPAPLGCAQAVREKGLQGKISVVGSAVEADSQEFLEDGSLDSASLWDCPSLGYLTVSIAKTMLDGQKLTNGMELKGKDGTIKLQLKSDGKTVIMGPPADYVKK